MNIAEKIKTARKRAGMSQQELADAIHVSRSAVAKWESDKGLPDIENLKALAKLFGMTLDELAGEGDEVHCTLRKPMPAEDPEEAVRARWPEAVRIDWMFLRHDFGRVGRFLNALSFGWLGSLWRIVHDWECNVDRCRYYLVDNFDEHIFVRVEDGDMYITPLGRRVLRSELDTFRHEGRTYTGGGIIKEKERTDSVNRFWGYYNNGAYQVGCLEHTMYLFDAEGRELARFKDLRHAPRGAFRPGTNIFVLRSTEGRLAVYDCDQRKLLQKFDFSNVHYAQDDGFCFSPDGELLYNVERSPGEFTTRLTVYETERFTPVRVLWEGEAQKVLSEVYYDEARGQVQLLYFVRGADGCPEAWNVGTAEGEDIAILRPLSGEAHEFLRGWLSLRTFGFTEEAMAWSVLHYDGYTNAQLRTLRDREPDLCAFDLGQMLDALQKI